MLMLFSFSVVSNSFQPLKLQHTRLPCPSPSSGVAQTDVHWVNDAIQPSCPLSAPSPSAINLSQHQGLFQCVSSSYQVAKVLGLQLRHQSFQWIPGLLSFKIDWFDLLAVLGTLKSLLQHHRLKATVCHCFPIYLPWSDVTGCHDLCFLKVEF